MNGNRIAIIGIIIEKSESVEKVNALLHDYSNVIVGRMGVPCKDRGVSIISVALDATQDSINTLAGKLGRIDGVSSKALCVSK